MGIHHFTPTERRAQLRELAALLDQLIPIVAALPDFELRVPEYERARDRAMQLAQSNSFTQEELSNLSSAVPDLFMRHRDWVPPLEPRADGGWKAVDWFLRLEEKLEPVLKAAEELRFVGYRD